VKNAQQVAFGFTGKELDAETGLYYFGARYYDARTSVWVSPDPILDKYLPTGDKEKDKKLPGMGGVFNSFNLGLYSYGHLNPVKFVDPDGKAPKFNWITFYQRLSGNKEVPSLDEVRDKIGWFAAEVKGIAVVTGLTLGAAVELYASGVAFGGLVTQETIINMLINSARPGIVPFWLQDAIDAVKHGKDGLAYAFSSEGGTIAMLGLLGTDQFPVLDIGLDYMKYKNKGSASKQGNSQNQNSSSQKQNQNQTGKQGGNNGNYSYSISGEAHYKKEEIKNQAKSEEKHRAKY